MAIVRDKRKSAPAYSLLDLSELEDDVRKDIIEDAQNGGGHYGVRVVEESVNGGARAPIYGVYNDGPDADRWASAKEELGLSGSEVDDSVAYQNAGGLVADPRREAAIREAAAQRVEGEAARIRAGEEADLAEITGEDGAPAREATGRTTGGAHALNIVDETLDPNATNEVSDAENQPPAKTSKNKAPK